MYQSSALTDNFDILDQIYPIKGISFKANITIEFCIFELV